jgi:hypothetical protein
VAKRTFVIAGIILAVIIGVFSACTFVVSHERESLARAAGAGSGTARFLIAGSNFWARYFIFCIMACLSLGFFVRRILMEIGWW